MALPAEGMRESSGCTGNVLILDVGSGHMAICVCKNSSNDVLNICALYLCYTSIKF